MSKARIPLATYRFQFHKEFTFAKATGLVPYLASLGVTHCYASPYLRARPGSTHGYDIIDHNNLNPEIGTPEDFEKFVEALHAHGMGQILDIVPNHMGVMGSDNAWWLDVLENGRASIYADYFDIDWEPLKDELQGKVLLPVLGDQYGNVLDSGELKLYFDPLKGEFSIFYHQHRFPITPNEYPRILLIAIKQLEGELGADNNSFLELQNLISAFSHLPSRHETDAAKKSERARDKEINKRRLAELCVKSSEILAHLAHAVERMNGTAGDSKSFDEMHELIKVQAYRLAYWRVAADDINYRRFFDINELAGLRMENEAVFEATHRFVLDLLRQGKVDGLRIDHPDGLYNPAQYFRRLQSSLASGTNETDPLYVVIEKILTGDERLPEKWPVNGTTGYEFANLVNGLFIDPASLGRMDRIYQVFLGQKVRFDDLVYRCKNLVMDAALASELNVLANLLSRIALSNRHTCDFTVNSLREGLSEIVAVFPVYRTYVTEDHVSDTDRKYIEEAIRSAKLQSSVADASVFDFIQGILLTEKPAGQGKIYMRAVVQFAMKFQQFTSAVMAKGLEDTSFYRYTRLLSLNEVGGDPRRFGVSPETFHRSNRERAKFWPHALLDTSTHDSKRSEDVRCRIDVLSEIPALWRKSLRRWRELNQDKKVLLAGAEAPSRNDEFMFYQTLLGVWSNVEGEARESLLQRIEEFMLKAVREAKDKTSWSNTNTEYESALSAFVKAVLGPSSGPFMDDFFTLQSYVSRLGMLNSLSQTLLKLTSPGVPDIYQGNELWDLSLVDPDNRRPVDYDLRRKLLAELQTWPQGNPETIVANLREMITALGDGRAKLYLTWKTLQLRKQFPALFSQGEYVPLAVQGPKANHIVAYALLNGASTLVVAVPRLFHTLLGGKELPMDASTWQDTRVEIPFSLNGSALINVFTSSTAKVEENQLSSSILASAIFADFPFALLLNGRP